MKYNLYSKNETNKNGLSLTFFVSSDDPYKMRQKGFLQHDSSNNLAQLEKKAENLNKTQYYHIMGSVYPQHPKYHLRVTPYKYLQNITPGDLHCFTTQNFRGVERTMGWNKTHAKQD